MDKIIKRDMSGQPRMNSTRNLAHIWQILQKELLPLGEVQSNPRRPQRRLHCLHCGCRRSIRPRAHDQQASVQFGRLKELQNI
jgi:hypothetical protein